MSRYIPVSTAMDSEDHYHSPYDTHELDSDAHYEAPSCLKRNPSGSLFIPAGPAGDSSSPGEKTLPLESRLRYSTTSGYSPHHHQHQRAGAYSPQHSTSTASSSRPEQAREVGQSQVYNVGTLGTRLGNTLLSRAGAQSPARSPGHLDSTRSVSLS